jgi:multiple sugar transport system ATP-binding protein
MSSIAYDHATKRSGDVVAVDDLDRFVEDREVLGFAGPPGCRKSTGRWMLAGLEEITKGTIAIGDWRVNDVPPKDRDIVSVFQSYPLCPHMSVVW